MENKFKYADGATRHAMKKEELRKLYKDIENLIADLTPEEYKQSQDAFIEVLTVIHQRERKTK